MAIVGGDVQSRTNPGSVTLTQPPHSADDVGYVFSFVDDDLGTVTLDTLGWSLLVQQFDTGGRDRQIALWRRVYPSDSEADVVVSLAGDNEELTASLVVVDSADTTTPEDVVVVVNAFENSINEPNPAITTITDGATLLLFQGLTHDATAGQGPPAATTLVAAASSDAQDFAIVATAVLLDAGTAGLQTPGAWTHTPGTQAGVADGNGVTVAVRAAAGGGGIERAVADTVGITDEVAAVSTSARAVDDSVGITDNIVAVLDTPGQQALADDVGITDEVTAVASSARAVDDTVGITDEVAASLAGARAVTDTVGITDEITATVIYGRAVADTIGITDDIDQTSQILRTIADLLVITDDVVADGPDAIVAEINDTVGITDEITATVERPSGSLSLSAMLEQLRQTAVEARKISDDVTVCPNDATRLITGSDGHLVCPFDGWRPIDHPGQRGWI